MLWMECSDAKPPILFGMLAKQSPSLFSFGAYQQRFVILQDGVMYWSASGACSSVGPDGPPGCKGRVDFTSNPGCQCVNDLSSKTRFELQPKDGQWATGDFTGASSGRILKFDTLGRKPDREEWLKSFQAHIAYGDNFYNRKLGSAEKNAGTSGSASAVASNVSPSCDAAFIPSQGASNRSTETEDAIAAHRAKVRSNEQRMQAKRNSPVIRELSDDDVAALAVASTASMQRRAQEEEEDAAEEIICT